MAAVRGAIVLADGDAPARAALDVAWPGWADGLAFVIAADGGARHAVPLGLRIDAWIGDGDSIDPGQLDALAAAGATIERVPTDKDETDTELAVARAVASGARRIAVLGALGGARLDHALGNVALLVSPVLADVDAAIYDAAGARVTAIAAPGPGGAAVRRSLPGRSGDVVSLLPIGGDAIGVTTSGLRYPLADETLELGRTRGVSNVRTSNEATVTLRAGRVLVIETPVTVGP